jgi:hypothetical protein
VKPQQGVEQREAVAVCVGFPTGGCASRRSLLDSLSRRFLSWSCCGGLAEVRLVGGRGGLRGLCLGRLVGVLSKRRLEAFRRLRRVLRFLRCGLRLLVRLLLVAAAASESQCDTLPSRLRHGPQGGAFQASLAPDLQDDTNCPMIVLGLRTRRVDMRAHEVRMLRGRRRPGVKWLRSHI